MSEQGITPEEYAAFLEKGKWYAHADKNDSGELAYHALGIAGEGGEYVDMVKKTVRVVVPNAVCKAP